MTGAASGIGLAVSEAFVAVGMRVVMADVDEERLGSHAERLHATGADVHPVVVDVREPESVDRLGRAVIDHYGVLHVAVNNVGVVGGGNSWEISLEEWRRVLDVDLWGVIHGVRTFVPLILASGAEGHVVNVASMAAVLALPRLAPYTVAKHGILGLTDVLRSELGAIEAPIGASVVMPGMIKTAMNPIGTVEPAAVAANVLDAIRRDRPYVFTDDHSTAGVEDRLRAIMAARVRCDHVTTPASPSDQLVLASDDGPVRTLTLNRPTRLNAFTSGSYRRLAGLLNEAGDDPGVRVVVLRGEGRAFCSGVDLEELSVDQGEGGRRLGETFDALIEVLVAFPKPLVAAVHGPAVGFGATILLHCDVVLVADDARLRFPFTSLSTAPEAGSSVLLPALVGPQRAAELLFTSRWIDASEAVQYGLALSSCSREGLDAEVAALADRIAQQPAEAVTSAKRLLRASRSDLVHAASARERAEAGVLTAAFGPPGHGGRPR